MLYALPREALTELARQCTISQTDHALGRCFVASLAFAHAARDLGDLTLLRWQISGDAEFKEHWALRLSLTEALDVTRVQVDGNSNVIKTIASYPAGYCLSGEYPAARLLAYCNFSAGILVGMSLYGAVGARCFMCWHDIVRALSWRAKLKNMWSGLLELERYLLVMLLGGSARLLNQRKVALLKRLEKTHSES